MRKIAACFFFCLLGSASCQRQQDEIKVYRLAKPNDETPSSASHGVQSTNVDLNALAAGTSEVKWEIPPGWSSVPASAMRYASFAALADDPEKKVDVSVVTFPGDGGDDVGNINRWRQQIGLAPVENATDIVPLKTEGATFQTIDLAGPNARTVVAWTRKNGRAWFFKATGPADAVEKQKANFVKFVQSVRF